MDETLVDFIEESGIILAMVGLLFALQNMQLSRRLMREGRLISHDHQLLTEATGENRMHVIRCVADMQRRSLPVIPLADSCQP